MLLTKPSSNYDYGVRYGFDAEVSLALTQSTPTVPPDFVVRTPGENAALSYKP